MTVSSASFLPLSAEICTLRLATASLRTWSISVRNTLHDCSSLLSIETASAWTVDVRLSNRPLKSTMVALRLLSLSFTVDSSSLILTFNFSYTLSTMRATSKRSLHAFSKPSCKSFIIFSSLWMRTCTSSSSILRHVRVIFTSMLSTMRMISAWPLPASSRPPVRSFPISSSHAIRSFASCSSCFCKSVVTDLTSCRAVCTHCSVTVSLCLSVRAADSLLISSAKRSNSDCILLPSSASPAALDFTSFSNKLRVRASVELIRFSSSSV
mmetsp:Transcript_71927/g.131265  ORF Transcript_71927/g.131265 Transcript_71927/m.131265 type:complete len:268 (-) Transcript_71927:286-1089(-)